MSDRYGRVVDYHNEGLTNAAIARREGVSRERVRQLLARGRPPLAVGRPRSGLDERRLGRAFDRHLSNRTAAHTGHGSCDLSCVADIATEYREDVRRG